MNIESLTIYVNKDKEEVRVFYTLGHTKVEYAESYRKYMGHIFDELRPGATRVTIVDAETAIAAASARATKKTLEEVWRKHYE